MSVEFKVPGDFVVQQSPQNLPPVYNGEKMVVYGVLSPKSTPQDRELSGKAILKGQILGKKMEHSVPFSINPVATRSPSLPAIHHLAAKALIKDWQDQGTSKEEIVKLSVDSSVISSHTAFIAVDEESSEPVTGAMKTWDVQALGALYRSGSNLSMSMSNCSSDSECDYEGELEDFEEEDELVEMVPAKRKMNFSLSAPKSLSTALPSQAAAPIVSDTLTSIITAQQADGSWKLDSTLTQLLAKPQKVIEDACPVKYNKAISVIWATVLTLTLLKKKYSSQQDEWELIAMKAESWVKKQAQSSGIAVKDFYTAAEMFV